MSDYGWTAVSNRNKAVSQEREGVQNNYNTRNNIKVRKRGRPSNNPNAPSNRPQPKVKQPIEEEDKINQIPSFYIDDSIDFNTKINILTPLELWSEYINPHVSYSLCESIVTEDSTDKSPYIFVSAVSLTNFVTEIRKQIEEANNQFFHDFNWERVSDACGLSVRACTEIWWSIDDRVVRIADGYLIILDMKHYKEIDNKIILRCRSRIRALLDIAEKYNLDDIIN